MEILEKVAYMKGLAEGLGLDTKSKEGKLLTVMMDILDDIALELRDLGDGHGELEEALDAVSDDLSDVESYLYEMDGEYEEDDGEDEDGEVYATTCPNCEEEIFFDESVLEEGSVLCWPTAGWSAPAAARSWTLTWRRTAADAAEPAARRRTARRAKRTELSGPQNSAEDRCCPGGRRRFLAE